MTQIEKQAWELIARLSPVQQYYFALKILQSVEPREIEEVSDDMTADSLHDKLWKGEEHLIQLVLSRKKEIEEGSATTLTREQFAKDIRKRIDQHRS